MFDCNIRVGATPCGGGGHFDVTMEILGRHTITRRVHHSELRRRPTKEEIALVADVLLRLSARQLTVGDHAEVRAKLHGRQLRGRRVTL